LMVCWSWFLVLGSGCWSSVRKPITTTDNQPTTTIDQRTKNAFQVTVSRHSHLYITAAKGGGFLRLTKHVMSSVIDIDRVSKVFKTRRGNVHALREASLCVERGEIFGLLGLNGAGKSTMVKILLDLVRPTSGRALLFDEPVSARRWNDRVGYLPELFRAPDSLNSRQVLVYLGSLSKLSGRRLEDRVEKVLDLAGLQNEANRSVKGFSKGMMLRLGIAQAILHQPELLILDEPTDGLDPLGKKIVRTLLSDLSRAGTTILINSHLLSEIELVANRIAILHKGTVVTQGKLTDLLPKSQGFEVALSRNPGLTEPWVFRQRGASWLCEVEGRDLQKLLSVLGRNRIDIEAVQPLRTTLEDFFLHYVAETSHASSSDLSTSNP